MSKVTDYAAMDVAEYTETVGGAVVEGAFEKGDE